MGNKKIEREHKFLIVGTGRCGSSLLSAILANAGANFGLEPLKDWNIRRGALEHFYVHEAYKWYARAQKINTSAIPKTLGYRFCIKRCRECLKKLFQEADFAKSTNLIWLVKQAEIAVTPKIRIIGIYRNFSDYLISRYRKFGKDYKRWREVWLNANYTLLIQGEIYDSSFVSYEELVNFQEKGWAVNLSKLTGLSKDDLLEWREKIVNKRLVGREPRNLFEDEETRKLYNSLRSKGKGIGV